MIDGEGMGEYGTSGGGSYVNQAALQGLQKTADKIEWNKENIQKFESNSSYLGFSGSRDSEMTECNNRMCELKEQMRSFVNFEKDSEYMGADGSYKKIPSKRAIMSRMKAVSKAKRKARAKRPSMKAMMQKRKGRPSNQALTPNIARRKRKMQIQSQRSAPARRKKPNLLIKGAVPEQRGMKGKRIAPGTATKVEMGLSPEIQDQKIRIPARSNFSNADGSKVKVALSSVPWKEIGIGTVVAVAGIVIYKQLNK